MSLDLKKTPLGTAQGLGSAKDGTGHWWAQRVSAVLIIPLAIYLLFTFLGLQSYDHITVKMWLQQPYVAASMLMFVLSIFFHSELGIQVVVEDYVGGRLKVISLLLLKFIHILVAVVAVISILRIYLA
ncbi:MAG: succinate dehydrogenase, hydrophobic membrane anchor protein [Gammaproteobacteria bacterium]|nr:succinate dehydrogenase, hydrophobic membrane anchor protein [Gammaproteobacteria bacterium]NNC96541.1 succinate dehydrogenase, hydrophobic membrane anchor protein [Gammaproteobacteria bacterium]NNM13045.1 succinate dehydrogenase, hydrophobic membrane anchor protein [Gammaproteobacteria bacterium]